MIQKNESDDIEAVPVEDIDLFSEAAMLNAYTICHNIQVEMSNIDKLSSQVSILQTSNGPYNSWWIASGCHVGVLGVIGGN